VNGTPDWEKGKGGKTPFNSQLQKEEKTSYGGPSETVIQGEGTSNLEKKSDGISRIE